jgi:hypothetical protein
MSLQIFHQRKSKIDSLISKCKTIEDLELSNNFARYIAIRISGLIETTARDCYGQYTREKASPEVHRYVTAKLKRFQNPKVKDIINLAGDFKEDWAKELEGIDEEISVAVASIVAIRNTVSHGGDQGITLGKVQKYYKQVLKFLELIQQQCDLK